MTTRIRPGARTWSLIRDECAHREYELTHLIDCDTTDGPANALQTPGLPLPGSLWIIQGDADLWAWCKWNAEVKPLVENEPNTLFEIKQFFTTKWPQSCYCKDSQVEDPLLEPQQVSGSFVKYTEEAAFDRFGNQLKYSSHEQIRGAQVEFDANRHSVHVEQNVLLLQLELVESMRDTVNAFPLWGLQPRMVKLSNFQWKKNFHGNCFAYYTRMFDFDTDSRTFDRVLADEGTKVLKGHWGQVPSGAGTATRLGWVLEQIDGADPDPANPLHFIRAKDLQGENIRVVLDGQGKPAETSVGVKITGIVPSPFDPTQVTITTATAHGLAGSSTFSIVGSSKPYYDNDYVPLSIPATNSVVATSPIDNGDSATGGILYVVGKNPGAIRVEKYTESDFLLLGIPVIL